MGIALQNGQSLSCAKKVSNLSYLLPVVWKRGVLFVYSSEKQYLCRPIVGIDTHE